MRFPALKPAVMGVALAGAMLFVACGGDSDDESTPEPTDTAEPTATADNGGGNGGDGELIVDGLPAAEYYSINCTACHGADRGGVTGLGKPLLPDALTEDDDFYRDTIANGRSGTAMPAWGEGGAGLSDDDISALISFIRTEP